MKHLIMAAAALWVIFQIAGMVSSSRDSDLSGPVARLLDPPQRFVMSPYHNGYFYLFGLTAAAPLDPAKTGYEIWVEESEDARHADIDEDRAGLTLSVSFDSTATAWEAEDPLHEFHKKDAPFRTDIEGSQTLLARYQRWLGMPFDDWGFGRRATPRYQDIMGTHRLYVTEGFALGAMQGLDRLSQELHFWRIVLREAKTIDTKLLAQVVIVDDINLLSRILAKPTLDKAILTMGLQLTLPLSESEYSLRWPIRHQLALAVKDRRTGGITRDSHGEHTSASKERFLSSANLPLTAFESIKHPPSRSWLSLPLPSSQTGDTYALYYDAVITASEHGAKRLPSMQDVRRNIQRGMIESLLNPRPVEPNWEIFYRKLMETDTRLRLASLQIQLRRSSARTAVPTRLAEVGSQYFDPFTGLPMLWSPTQQKIYSVGNDRLDDGGDPTFDISVPAIIATVQTVATKPVQSLRSPQPARH